MLEITPFRFEDRAAWEVLARGYKAFYKTVVSDSGYDATWRRLLRDEDVHGLAARLDGRVIGIAHFMFHTNAWSPDQCYLQDLFVDEGVRGKGAARALIEKVAEVARARRAPRLYWHTQHDNTVARALYDKVARHYGFIRYDIMLE